MTNKKRYVVTCMDGAWLCSPAAYVRILKTLRDTGEVNLDDVRGAKYIGYVAKNVTDGLDDDIIAQELDRVRSG